MMNERLLTIFFPEYLATTVSFVSEFFRLGSGFSDLYLSSKKAGNTLASRSPRECTD